MNAFFGLDTPRDVAAAYVEAHQQFEKLLAVRDEAEIKIRDAEKELIALEEWLVKILDASDANAMRIDDREGTLHVLSVNTDDGIDMITPEWTHKLAMVEQDDARKSDKLIGHPMATVNGDHADFVVS